MKYFFFFFKVYNPDIAKVNCMPFFILKKNQRVLTLFSLVRATNPLPKKHTLNIDSVVIVGSRENLIRTGEP